MTAGIDFLLLLPFETTRHILSFLDSRSLFACSCLSKTWYDALNYLCPEIWFEACLRAGIYIRKDKCTDVTEWKSFLHKMVARKLDILEGKCFNIFANILEDRIKAMFIHSDKIAIAYSDRIDMWTYPSAERLGVLGCNFEPFILKFDDSIIIAASEDGRMSSWSTTNGVYLKEYTNDDSSLTSFDFLTDRDTIACSFYSISIRLWSIFEVGVTARIYTHQSTPIVKVLLVPDPNHSANEERKRSLLFSLAMDNVVLSKVELKYGAFTSRYYFSFETTYLLNFLSVQPSFDVLPTDVFSKNHEGLLFDGEFLYILPPIPTRISCTIFKWKLKTLECWRVISASNIVGLLGIGEQYLAYRKRLDNDHEFVIAADKFGKETIASVNAPRRRTSLHEERNIYYIEDDCMCLGYKAWLDGLNGENDCGNVYVSIMEDKFRLCIANFIPRNE